MSETPTPSDTPEVDSVSYLAIADPPFRGVREEMNGQRFVVESIFARTLERQRDEALTDRARLEQGVESLTAQLDALRGVADMLGIAKRELQSVRAEVERLTKRNQFLEQYTPKTNLGLITELDTLRAKLAEVTAERDALHIELKETLAAFDAVIRGGLQP